MSSFKLSSGSGLEKLLVLIPAWQPDGRLLSLVEELRGCGFAAILIVDDGSSAAAAAIFRELQQLSSVRVARHERNLGKGCALKTGIEFILREMPDMEGVVTADADGQHTAADIVRVAEALRKEQGSVLLGARTLTGSVPLRCRIGNGAMRAVFRLLTGVTLSDTQTGLRGLPRSLLQELVQLGGDRYEYEMVVLTHLCRTGKRPVEVPIETVYLDGNRSSHFKPIADSMRILFALARSVMQS